MNATGNRLISERFGGQLRAGLGTRVGWHIRHSPARCTTPGFSTSRAGRRSAFSLIELLVAIAVVAILAAMLLPALSRSRELGRRAVCQSNLRQLGLALSLYADDHNQYPTCFRLVAGGRGAGSFQSSFVSLWNALLLPHLGEAPGVFVCPSYPASFAWTREPSELGFHYPTNISGNRPFSYAANAHGAAAANFGLTRTAPLLGDAVSRRPAEFAAPSDTIAIGDDTHGTADRPSSGWVKLGKWGIFTPGLFSGGFPNRAGAIGTLHNQGGNMVFLDGHVEWNRWWRWIEKSDAAARRWNFDNLPHPENWAP